MKDTTVIDGQLGQLAIKQNELFRRAKEGHYASMDQVNDALQQVIEGQAPMPPVRKRTIKKAKPEPAILAFHAEVLVQPLLESFNPHEFFKDRQGLYLWNDMQRVLKDAKPVEPAQGTAKLRSFDLTKNAYDREIKAELPENHEVELWQIAKLIDAQKNGEDGPLLTNGYANIFYVAGFAVSVSWSAGSRGWYVDDWKLGGAYWDADYRVFSRN